MNKKQTEPAIIEIKPDQKTKPLIISSLTTVIFLCIGAVLVILGIFNSFLQWDIFGPKLEKILYGIFVSSVSLGGFGVAITLVIGIQEVVKGVNRLSKSEGDIDLTSDKYLLRRYIFIFWGLISFFTILVIAFATANHFIQNQRNAVFKKIAAEQLQRFEPKFPEVFSQLSLSNDNTVPDEFFDLFKTIQNLSFVSLVEVYVPDLKDQDFMWKNSDWYKSDKEDVKFTRFFISKDFEMDIKKLIEGSSNILNELNSKREFVWYFLVKDKKDKKDIAVAVLRILGNTRESFRDYDF